MRERRHDYELMFIISPLKSSEEDVAAAIGRITTTITTLGGEVLDTNHAAPWGRRKFAYPIRAYSEGEASRRVFTEGYYVLIRFKLPTSQIAEFERPLKLADSILRYMLTLVDMRAERESVAVASDADAELDGDDEDTEE
jgi:small subunit ribosomal protein S6